MDHKRIKSNHILPLKSGEVCSYSGMQKPLKFVLVIVVFILWIPRPKAQLTLLVNIFTLRYFWYKTYNSWTAVTQNVVGKRLALCCKDNPPFEGRKEEDLNVKRRGFICRSPFSTWQLWVLGLPSGKKLHVFNSSLLKWYSRGAGEHEQVAGFYLPVSSFWWFWGYWSQSSFRYNDWWELFIQHNSWESWINSE